MNEFKKILIALLVLIILIGAFWFLWQFLESRHRSLQKELLETERQIQVTEQELSKLINLAPEKRQQRAIEREVLLLQKAQQDTVPSGLSVELVGDKKIIKNQAQGYNLTVPASLIITRSVTSDRLELHDRRLMCQDPLCDPVIRITVNENNPNQWLIEQWLANEEQKTGALIYSPRERIALGAETTYRITQKIPGRFDGFYYYWTKDKKIYNLRISRLNDEIYRVYLATLNK